MVKNVTIIRVTRLAGEMAHGLRCHHTRTESSLKARPLFTVCDTFAGWLVSVTGECLAFAYGVTVAILAKRHYVWLRWLSPLVWRCYVITSPRATSLIYTGCHAIVVKAVVTLPAPPPRHHGITTGYRTASASIRPRWRMVIRSSRSLR